jgi:DNA-binding transcriptional ArsR family regulator
MILLAQKYGIAIVLVHHLRKAGSDDAFDTVSGTLGLTGAADATLVLRRETTGNIVLHGRARDLVELEKAMEFNRTTCRWTVRGDAGVARRSAERNAILSARGEIGEKASPNEIAAVAGMSSTSVRQALVRMRKTGLVRRSEYGKYEAVAGECDSVTEE